MQTAAYLSSTSLRSQLIDERRERAQLEQALELCSCALDAANTHFMITDMRRHGWPIVYVNRSMARDHGYEPGELLGKSAKRLVGSELNAVALLDINRALRNGDSLRTEVQSRRKDGTTFWAGISLQPIRDALGSVTHYLSVGADITSRRAEEQDKRRLQEQVVSGMRERERIAIELRFAQKLESVGRLAAGIAHEINTPIQYIGDSLAFVQAGLANLDALLVASSGGYQRVAAGLAIAEVMEDLRLLEAKLDRPFLAVEMPKAIVRALEGVTRVTGIVSAMREFAHPDGSQRSAADLNHALETTLTVAKGEYKHIATVETRFGAIPEVICNVGELNQVFVNLIVNSAHAIASAGRNLESGRIVVSTATVGSSVEILIEDNGCGIEPDNLEKIFDPFFTTKEVGKGTGQGLAIARSIVVDKHGGALTVES
ncbi:MAG: ATP-binding protein, partial [Gammaproteobacteria bacterium]